MDSGSWHSSVNAVIDQLALGLDLFGPHAAWLWALPVFWAVVVTLLWAYTTWQQRRSNQEYLAYASRQLPMLRRIARQRAQEVAFSRRTDRF